MKNTEDWFFIVKYHSPLASNHDEPRQKKRSIQLYTPKHHSPFIFDNNKFKWNKENIV